MDSKEIFNKIALSYNIMDYILFGSLSVSDLMIVLFLISTLVQLFYYFFFYSRVPFSKIKEIQTVVQPVSVVICARNEARNLEKNLPFVLNQDYPEYEVIVVNDCSEDDTAELLEDLGKKYARLKTTHIKKDAKFTHGKKLALTIGIKAASHEWLLLTDADCKPGSEKWISGMQRNFGNKTSVVLGYGAYSREKSLINNFIRFDTFFIAIQYFGFAMAGIPYMGIGRNLAYRKALFFENKGFAAHRKLASGDDDLFINQVATAENTKVEFSFNTHTYSEAEKTFSAWLRQKKRHLTTGSHYNMGTKYLLAGELISRVSFYVLFILLLINLKFLIIILAAFFVRLSTMLTIYKIGMTRLKEVNLFVSSLFYDIFSPFINLSLVISNIFSSPPPTWK